MKFPNAARGVKMLFRAEILDLIASFTMIIAVALALVTAAGANANPDINAGTAVAGMSTIVFMSASVVLAIVAGVLALVGIIFASKDEVSFKTALIAIIIGVVAAVVMGIFSGNATVNAICQSIQRVMDIIVTIFVINGITNLADKMHNIVVGTKGRRLLYIIVCVFVLSLIANIIVLIFGGMFASVTATIIALAAAVLEVIGYIIYLTMLAQAKKMLAE